MNELLQEGRALYAYEISGQYDQDDQKDEELEGVWCSVYDIVNLADFGIIDPLEKEDLEEAVAWLLKAQPSTKSHQQDALSQFLK